MRGIALICVATATALTAVACGSKSPGAGTPTPSNTVTATPTPPTTPAPTPTPSGTPPAGGSYLPLKSGSIWNYATVTYKTSGPVPDTKTVTCGPLGDIGGLKAGTNGYKLTSTTGSGKYKYDWDEDRGILVTRHREQSYDAASTELTESYYNPSKLIIDMQAARLVTGATYYENYTEATHDFTLATDTSTTHFVTWMVVSTNATNPLGGGFCPCLELSRHSQSSTNLSSDKKYWFKQGVGKVEEDTIDNTGAIKATENLTNYTP